MDRAQSLYHEGRYTEGIRVAEEALSVAEQTFGFEHDAVATTLNNLAGLYHSQGRLSEAEPLFKPPL